MSLLQNFGIKDEEDQEFITNKIENLVEKYNKKTQKDKETTSEEEDSSDHGNDVWK